MDNPNSGRRTDAKVQGDMMDGILASAKKSAELSYPPQSYDYPETLVELVKTFTDIWLLPESSIPRKIEKGKYDYWILQLEDLRRLFSSDARMRIAMLRAKENYERSDHRLVIFEPKSVRNIVVSAIAELRTEERNLKALEQERNERELLDKNIVSPNRFRKLKGE